MELLISLKLNLTQSSEFNTHLLVSSNEESTSCFHVRSSILILIYVLIKTFLYVFNVHSANTVLSLGGPGEPLYKPLFRRLAAATITI